VVRAAVESAAEFYFDRGIAESTAKRYAAVWKKYVCVCKCMGWTPLPTTEEKAIAYVVSLAAEGVQAATVKYHLAGIRQAQIKAGLKAPDWGAMAKLSQIRTGIARHRAVSGPSVAVRNPVTLGHLKAMQAVWKKCGGRGVMLWAAACMCFFGCLRAGEALAPDAGGFDSNAHLTFDDVRVDDLEKPRVVLVRIKESKMDRLRRGATVSLGWTGEGICPVKAVLHFIVQRKSGPGPFFSDEAGKALTRREFVSEVKKALSSAGMTNHDISGHSFRIGAATAAAQSGASVDEIKALGRWKSREYQGYVRRGDGGQSSLAKKLAKQAESEEPDK